MSEPLNKQSRKMRVYCCDGEPPCVAFAAYVAKYLNVELVSIPKPRIVSSPKPEDGDICFGSYWPDVKARFTYDLKHHRSLFDVVNELFSAVERRDMAPATTSTRLY